ncbi:hypothetical protein [Actinoplanes sp. HUAS TT8]|uniref:hypothetical protein n=1 Tax=Actinoplanes sp. HUAS TT8 TaxID=3447453 RepID=UPI003F51DA32
MFLALAAAGGLVYLRTRDDPGPKPAIAAAQAATALRDQDATALKATYFDQKGLDVTGDLTILKGGDTTGTLTDSGGGKAEYLASGENAEVRGDQAWWARRDPARLGILNNNWVRPEGYAFPMESNGLDPDALAGMVDWVRNGGAPADDVNTVAGVPVVGMRRDGWTVAFSRARPYRLVWFGGPLREGTPIGSAGETTAATPPYISALVNVPPGDVKKVSLPENALVEEKTAAKLPAFDVTVNATTCKTVTCTWTVTVKNVGAAAGAATVIASVTPGMTRTQVKSLGTMAPGDSRTTTTFSFPNPAPTNKNVPADYRAEVYSPELHGDNLKLMRQLQEKGLVPGRSPVLSRLDPSQATAMLFTLDAMADYPKFDPDKALDATENAVNLGLLPELGELVRSRRIENPPILYTKLQDIIFEYDTGAPGTPVKEKTGNRRQLQIAASVLREDPDATIAFDKDGVDLLVHSTQRKLIAIQTKAISSDSIGANVRGAVKELSEHAPARSQHVVYLYVDAGAGFPHAAGRDWFDAQLKPLSSELCHGGADEVVIVNQTGTQRWSQDQIPGCR